VPRPKAPANRRTVTIIDEPFPVRACPVVELQSAGPHSEVGIGPWVVGGVQCGSAAVAERSPDALSSNGPPVQTFEIFLERPLSPTPDRREVFDVKHFRKQRAHLMRPYRQHNVALKFIRKQCEEGGHSGHRDILQKETCAEIIKGAGTTYSFSGDAVWDWNWHDMVAQMRDDSMEVAVTGKDRAGGIRSRGLVNCTIVQTDVYDHKRHAALKLEGHEPVQMLFEWHFVLHRDDGSFCYVRPAYSSPKIQYTDAHVEDSDWTLPDTGIGGTSGPGTYSWFKNRHQTGELKFDGRLKVTPA
jgi:hypothetical protein